MTEEQPDRDLRNQLNDLWKNTIEQFDGIKDVILRHSHVGRRKLDTAVLRRQRDTLFQELGERVFEQVVAGNLELSPQGVRMVERLHEVLGQIENTEAEINRIHKGETPETTGEFPALRPDGEPVEPPKTEGGPAAPTAEPAAKTAAEQAEQNRADTDKVDQDKAEQVQADSDEPKKVKEKKDKADGDEASPAKADAAEPKKARAETAKTDAPRKTKQPVDEPASSGDKGVASGAGEADPDAVEAAEAKPRRRRRPRRRKPKEESEGEAKAEKEED